MKNKLLNIVLLAGIVAVTACGPGKASQGSVSCTDSTAKLRYPIDSARQDIAYIDTILKAFVTKLDSTSGYDSTPVKAFTVRAADLFLAMGMTCPFPQVTYDHIRVYLGYNATARQFKLFVVPVQGAVSPPNVDSAAGSDLFFKVSPGNTNNDTMTVNPTGTFVLDLNAPCPSFCDWQSALIANPMGSKKK